MFQRYCTIKKKKKTLQKLHATKEMNYVISEFCTALNIYAKQIVNNDFFLSKNIFHYGLFLERKMKQRKTKN